MSKNGHPLDVKVNVTLLAIQKLHELDMTFSSKLILWLEWYDERVKFSNLKSKDFTNIGHEKASDVWIPPLIFNNSKKDTMVLLKQNAMLFVKKRGFPEMAKHSLINEDFFYKGSENTLVYAMGYQMTFSCIYDLSRYPFDTQTCQIEVMKSFIINHL